MFVLAVEGGIRVGICLYGSRGWGKMRHCLVLSNGTLPHCVAKDE